MPFRIGRHGRLPFWLVPLCALGMALGGTVACGLKTAPRPVSEVLPPTTGVRAWQREESVVVTWQMPDASQQERFGGLLGFELVLQARPRLCLDCPLPAPVRQRLPLRAPGLLRQGAVLFYTVSLAAQTGRVSLQVRTRFGLGLGPPGTLVQVERADEMPVPALSWRWAGGGEAGIARSVQFSWQTPRERIVQAIGTDGQPHERALYYRVNLYRRVPPESWPALPLNGQPLVEQQWIVPPLQAEFPPDATGEAYVLRFVDQHGNEGAPSPEVLIPLAGRRP